MGFLGLAGSRGLRVVGFAAPQAKCRNGLAQICLLLAAAGEQPARTVFTAGFRFWDSGSRMNRTNPNSKSTEL